MTKTFGQKIKGYRLKKKISQFKAELEFDLSTGILSRIENDKVNPTKETISI